MPRFDLVRLRAEPHAPHASGDPARGLDWGDYRVSLYDTAAGTLLHRDGFDSVLDPGARAQHAELGVRVPMPRKAARAAIERRRGPALFQPVLEVAIDPADGAIDRSALMPAGRVETIVSHGAPASKVDIAIVGDGYTEGEYAKFSDDAARATAYLFSIEPFAKRSHDFNVRTVFVGSSEGGVTDAYLGVRRRTAFGCAYGDGEAERTLSVRDPRALREAAAAAPYDFLLVVANSRRYGGSAHYGGPAVVAIDSAAARYLVVHEFAHVIGGLADEYYIPAGDGPAYAGNVEPWHPNVTLSGGKWPAPGGVGTWNKRDYDRYFADYVKRYLRLRDARADEARVEAFMRSESERQGALLGRSRARRVHLYEGANGYAKGVFRSEIDCAMFSLQTAYFCHACTAAIERAIDAHCG